MSTSLARSLRFLALTVAVFAGLGGWIGTARAGAWVQPRGVAFGKLSFLSQRTADRIGPEGESLPADASGADFVERQLFGYAEWGALERLTLLGAWGYKDQRVDSDPHYGTRSTTDIRVGGRWGLVQGPRALAVESVLSLPSYPRSDFSLAPSARRQFLPAGSGQLEAEFRLLGGLSLHPLPLYANADLGYRVRGGGFADQWLGVLELGGSAERLFAKLELRGLLSRGPRQTEELVGSVALSERSLRVSPEAAVQLTGPVWLSVAYTGVLSGRNTLDAGQWSLGFIYWRN